MTRSLRSLAIELRWVYGFYVGLQEKTKNGANTAISVIQAHIKMEAYGYAIADATKALELDPTNVKVYICYRAFYETKFLILTARKIGILAKSIGQHRHFEPSRRPQRFQIRH